jgi:hypothetical protein
MFRPPGSYENEAAATYFVQPHEFLWKRDSWNAIKIEKSKA